MKNHIKIGRKKLNRMANNLTMERTTVSIHQWFNRKVQTFNGGEKIEWFGNELISIKVGNKIFSA